MVYRLGYAVGDGLRDLERVQRQCAALVVTLVVVALLSAAVVLFV